MTASIFDAVVVGAGMAGASVAAELARTHRVLVLESEAQAGFHSTGRSVAIFSETYGGAQIRALSRASRAFLTGEDAAGRGAPVLTPRGTLYVARQDQLSSLDAMAASADVSGRARRVGAEGALALCPLLAPGYAAGGLHEPEARDIDVDALHQGFLRELRSRGGVLRLERPVTAVEPRLGGGWRVSTAAESFETPVLVNAAGAWADVVARLAGAVPLGVTPLRRTVVVAEGANTAPLPDLPLTIDVDEQFYFRGERGGLLISPADETPVSAEDARPDEYDVALGIDRVERATSFRARRVRSRWAGLRSFAPDRRPVIGFAEPGFFWLAGQGGYGIQTAPAAAALAAALVRGEDTPGELREAGVDASALSPARFADLGVRSQAAAPHASGGQLSTPSR